MYTPRGELNEELLQILYQNDFLGEWRKCRSKEQLICVLQKYGKSVSEEELVESLVVIRSYLDEEREVHLLSELELDEVAGGAPRSQTIYRNEIAGLLERRPGIAEELQEICSLLWK